jgi:hypothetical protein
MTDAELLGLLTAEERRELDQLLTPTPYDPMRGCPETSSTPC